MMRILFLTGNEHKLREAKEILAEHDVEGRALDLPEIQSLDPERIIREKLRAAQARIPDRDAAIMVEDVSFLIGETGLPGPFIKFFNETIGREGLVTFARAFGSERARAECHVGLLLPGEEPEFFIGTVTGRIVDPRGESGFGFDPVFEPDGQPAGKEQTYAEMASALKNRISHRRKALEEVRDRLRKPHEENL